MNMKIRKMPAMTNVGGGTDQERKAKQRMHKERILSIVMMLFVGKQSQLSLKKMHKLKIFFISHFKGFSYSPGLRTLS
jgi:hypothetical protein